MPAWSFSARKQRVWRVANVSCKLKGMKYGYARVSTDDQNAALQLEALRKAGCKTVFKDDGLSEPRPSALPCAAV